MIPEWNRIANLIHKRNLDGCKSDARIKINSAQELKQHHTSQEGPSLWAALLLYGGTMPRKKAHVYLIHFEHKYHHAGHYLGFTKHLWIRIITHRANMGARLLRAVNHAGINWVVVRTWTVESQDLERKLKNLKNSPRLCPICNPDLEGQVQNEYARMKWELDQSVYNPNLPLPW